MRTYHVCFLRSIPSPDRQASARIKCRPGPKHTRRAATWLTIHQRTCMASQPLLCRPFCWELCGLKALWEMMKDWSRERTWWVYLYGRGASSPSRNVTIKRGKAGPPLLLPEYKNIIESSVYELSQWSNWVRVDEIWRRRGKGGLVWHANTSRTRLVSAALYRWLFIKCIWRSSFKGYISIWSILK
jgi:hypothetical protein